MSHVIELEENRREVFSFSRPAAQLKGWKVVAWSELKPRIDVFEATGEMRTGLICGNNPVNLVDPEGLAWGDYWDVGASANYYRNVANTSQNPWAASAASLANATLSFWGAESVQESAERSGEAAGAGCTGRALGYGALTVGQIALTAGVADVGFVGREFSFGRNFRVAPLGNRTTSELGTLPHYHRRIVGPSGTTVPGGGIGRHRPWEGF